MLIQETIQKSMTHVPTDSKGQGRYFCHSIDDCKLSVEKEEHKGLCDNSYFYSHLRKSNSLDKTLKNCNEDAEVKLSTTDGLSWDGGNGRNEFSSSGCPPRV